MKVFGITGWKNAGKTTLVERLVADITGRGLRVSTVKHAHHDFDIDQPGRDSHRHRMAGAAQVLVASARRWALITELRGAPEPPLAALLATLAASSAKPCPGSRSAGRPPRIRRSRPATRGWWRSPATWPCLTRDCPSSRSTPPPRSRISS